MAITSKKVNAEEEILAEHHNSLVDDVTNLDAKKTSWSDVTDKPTTFTPSTHTHEISEVPGLEDRLKAIETQLAGGEV